MSDSMPADRPEMMAIGDSLFNGVRSLSIDAVRAGLSAPKQVADALDLPFLVPAYPRPVLFDLERDLGLGTAGKILDRAIENARAWLDPGPPWVVTERFDNIAIAQSDIDDLWTVNAGQARADAAMLLPLIAGGQLPLTRRLGLLPDLYFAINTAFLLNPAGRADLDRATPVEIVAARRPKRLLVCTGSNEGLYATGFLGEYDHQGIETIPGRMARLCEEIKAAYGRAGAGSADLPEMVFTNLVKPSTITNLMPQADPGPRDLRPNGYYAAYGPRVLGIGNSFTGAELRDIDRHIADVNDRTKVLVTAAFPAGRARIADIHAMSAGRDYKHWRETDEQAIWVKSQGRDRRLTNWPLTIVGGDDRRGGLASLDNMHPTSVGYGLMAQTILGVIDPSAVPRIDLVDLHARDDLLQNPPGGWELMRVVLDIAVNFLRFVQAREAEV